MIKKFFHFSLLLLALNLLKAQTWSTTGNSGTDPNINFIGTTDNNGLVFKTNNSNRAILKSNGNFHIGDFNPAPSSLENFKFGVDGRSIFQTSVDSDLIDIINTQQNVSFDYDLIYGLYKYYQPNDVGLLTLNSLVTPTKNETVFTARANGKIGMGTKQYNCANCSGYRLFVKDGIKTEKVKVEVAADNGWADYVFNDNYELRDLNSLEKFIKENKHLPEVPTTDEAIRNGIELKEMNILLLKKIEELTLYIIEQNKRIESLEKL